MAANIMWSTPRLSANDLGAVNVQDAIQNGLKTYMGTLEAGARPTQLQQESLHNELLNKILGSQAKYSDENMLTDLRNKKLNNQLLGINARYAQPRAEADLQGASLANALSRMNLKYLPQEVQARIAESQAKAQKSQFTQQILGQLLGTAPNFGGEPSGQLGAQMQEGQPQPGQGQGMLADQIQQAMQSKQRSPGLNYSQAVTAGKLLGLPEPKHVTVEGRTIAITPFGNIDMGVNGLSTRDTQLAKEDAKKISDLENVVINSQGKLDTFNELNNILGSPDFQAIRQLPAAGGLENWLTGKFGTKDQQNLVGRANTLMGNIIKDSARDFGGQFRVGEQALLNGMKPNPSDSLDVMKGKSEALTYLTEMMAKRAELEADLMRNNNMSPLQAKKEADKQIDQKTIKANIDKMLNPKKPTQAQALAELKRRGIKVG